jgi:hypothetical protein
MALMDMILIPLFKIGRVACWQIKGASKYFLKTFPKNLDDDWIERS